jgi:hypothetical protein
MAEQLPNDFVLPRVAVEEDLADGVPEPKIKDDWFAGQTITPTVPRPVNLRVDPFEQHMDAPAYPAYVGEKLWTIMPAGYIVKLHAETFKEFPPRQAPHISILMHY